MEKIKIEKKQEMIGVLRAKVLHPGDCEWSDYGVVSTNLVTNAAIAVFISVLQAGSAATMQSWKYHGTGTANTAEAFTDTILGAEVGSRVAGTQTSTGAGNYRSVATVTYTSNLTIREHGIFSAAVSGTLLDRSVLMTPITVVNGTQVQYDYQLVIIGG